MGRDKQGYGKRTGGLGMRELRGNVWLLGPRACKEQLLPVNWAFGTC